MEKSQQQGKLSEEGFRRAKELMLEHELGVLNEHREYVERMIQLSLFEGKVEGMKVGEQTDEFIKEIVGRELYTYEEEFLRRQDKLSHYASNVLGTRTSAMQNILFPEKTDEDREREREERKKNFREFANKKGKKRGR